MEKRNSSHSKSKSEPKGSAKSSSGKKRKNKGGKAKSCLLFFSNVAKKFGQHKKTSTSSNIAQYIMQEITATLPLRTLSNSTKIIPTKQSPPVLDKLTIQIIPIEEDVTAHAKDVEMGPTPELIAIKENAKQVNLDPQTSKRVPSKLKIAKPKNHIPKTPKEDLFTMPHMPLANSDVFKKQEEMRLLQKMKVKMEDAASNTNRERDTAEEIAKHVDTLRKISIIADEFNKKTVKVEKDDVNMNRTRQQRNHRLNDVPGARVNRQNYYNGNQQCYTTEQYDKFADGSETSYRSLRRKWAIPGNAPAEADNQSGFIFKYVHDTDSLVPSTYEEVTQQRQSPPPGIRNVLDNNLAGYYVRSNPSVESQTCSVQCKANSSSQSSQLGGISTRNVGCGCGYTKRQGSVQTSLTAIDSASHCAGGCSCSEEQECPMRCKTERAQPVSDYEPNTAYKYYTHMLFKQLSKMKSNLKRHISGAKCTCPHYYLCRNDSGTLTPCKISPELCENCLRKEEPKDSQPKFSSQSEQIASCADIMSSRTCPFASSKEGKPMHIVRQDSAIETHSQTYSSTVIAKYKNKENTVESLVRTIYIQDRKEKSAVMRECSAVQASTQKDNRYKKIQRQPNKDNDFNVAQKRRMCSDCDQSLSDGSLSN